MRDQRTRSSTVNVTLLDLSKDIAGACERYKIDHPGDAARLDTMKTHYEPGIIVAKSGEFYMLNRDGVGSSEPITDANPAQIALYAEFLPDAEGASASSTWPDLILSLSPEDIRQRLSTKTENLATFIRSFGGRIERNFREWNHAMSPLT